MKKILIIDETYFSEMREFNSTFYMKLLKWSAVERVEPHKSEGLVDCLL